MHAYESNFLFLARRTLFSHTCVASVVIIMLLNLGNEIGHVKRVFPTLHGHIELGSVPSHSSCEATNGGHV